MFSPFFGRRACVLARPSCWPTIITRKCSQDSDTLTPSIRVVSYNVLSDKLCRTSHYPHSDPDHVDNTERLARLKTKLEAEMDQGSIVCLQEVSRRWSGVLLPFLEAKGYTHASAPHGNSFNGYMGVYMAWPRDRFTVNKVVVERTADSVGWIKPPNWTCPACKASVFASKNRCFRCGHAKPSTKLSTEADSSSTSMQKTAMRFLRSFVRKLRQRGALERTPSKPLWDTWQQVARRSNCAVQVRLHDRSSGRRFCVVTYHMPCLFGSDEKCQVMVAHVALLMQSAQRFAGEDPLVVAGDFNFRPGTPSYDCVLRGSLDPGNSQHPPLPAPIICDGQWSPSFKPMRSAYLEAHGSEPVFTNFAWSEFNDSPFQETLDYLFLSSQWQVHTAERLPAVSDVAHLPGFPSAEEPSDHLLVAANLRLSSSP